MTDSYRTDSTTGFVLNFSQEAKKKARFECWALSNFVSNAPDAVVSSWRGEPKKRERPDFLVDRSDGTTLGVELATYADEAGMGDRARRARVRRSVNRKFNDKHDRSLHLAISWSGYVGNLPVNELGREILAIVRTAPDLPDIRKGRLQFTSSNVYAHQVMKRMSLTNMSDVNPLPEWKHQASEKLAVFPKFIGSIQFGTHDFESDPFWAGQIWVPSLTPSLLSKARTIIDHADSVSTYRKRCDECWLLLHPRPLQGDGRSLPAIFTADTEAFEKRHIDTEFDAVWIVDSDNVVVRAG